MAKAFTINPQSRFAPGQAIRFRRIDGAIADDIVRQCFWQNDIGSTVVYPALVLTDHSWCAERDVLTWCAS